MHDWIISLVAVLVSLATVVVSYFTNKENLKNARENMRSERDLDFRISLWNETIDLANELVLATNSKHLEQFANFTIAGKTNDTSDEDVLNKLNENCEQIYANMFKLCVKVQSLDGDCDAILEYVRSYAQRVIDLYQQMQEFYLNKQATKEQYGKIVAGVGEFNATDAEFSHKIQRYMAQLRGKLFTTEKRGGK